MKSLCLRLVVAVLGLVVFLSACSGGEEMIGGELHIFNWDDYFAPETLQKFEEEYGIKVYLDTFEDEQAMLSVIQSDSSKYDVIVASDIIISEMAAVKLLSELDHKALPNLSNIESSFLDQLWDPGNRFSVPYTWGSTGIVYNSERIPQPAKSWALLRDPQLAGRIALLNDPTVVIGLTLKSLGYSLNSGDEQQLAAVVRTLTAQSRILAGFLDTTTIKEKMLSGELWAAQIYNGDGAFVVSQASNLAFFIPAEGADLWVDSLAIPRDAKNRRAAHLFLNYILRPDVQAEISNYTGFAVPNRVALEQGLIDEEVLEDEASYPPGDQLERWLVPTSAERARRWNKIWAEVQREPNYSATAGR